MSEVCTYTPSVPVKKTGIGIGLPTVTLVLSTVSLKRFFIA